MQNKTNDVNNIITSLTTLIKEAVKEELLKHKQTEKTANYDQDKILTVAMLSKYLDLKRTTIYALTHRKAIPFFKKGKKLYFKKSEIDKWIESGRVLTNAELDAVAEKMQNKP